MTQRTELQVDKNDLRTTRIVSETVQPLADGEVLVAIDRFGLTANNVSYALTGDIIGYWQFYPAENNWGVVPVWGCGDIVASNCPELPVGERLYGFFPMASHTVLQPGNIAPEQFSDFSAHRRELPALYNAYRRTHSEPEAVQSFEIERCLLFPLFATSFLLYDFLLYNELFGATQILIGSVSSKTGFGLAKMLHEDPAVKARIVGLTSPGNLDFVRALDCCDDIVVYGEEATIAASEAAAYVDMSGDGRLTAALHRHLGDNMHASIMVGATHWESEPREEDLPGAPPQFFFAPSHVATREQEWGRGVPMTRAMEASMKVAAGVRDNMEVVWVHGAEALQSRWLDMLDNSVPAASGLMVSLA